jgi:hypothetical protein
MRKSSGSVKACRSGSAMKASAMSEAKYAGNATLRMALFERRSDSRPHHAMVSAVAICPPAQVVVTVPSS